MKEIPVARCEAAKSLVDKHKADYTEYGTDGAKHWKINTLSHLKIREIVYVTEGFKKRAGFIDTKGRAYMVPGLSAGVGDTVSIKGSTHYNHSYWIQLP